MLDADHAFLNMINYRAYTLDAVGEILSGEDVEANNDIAAIAAGWEFVALSKAAPAVLGVEIWEARRLVFSTHPRP